MKFPWDKIVPLLFQAVVAVGIFFLGCMYNEKTRKREEKRRKENLELMLSEELKRDYLILLELTQISPLEVILIDNSISKFSFSVYQKYLDRLDTLELSKVEKILAAYFFMEQIVDLYKEQVDPDRSCDTIHLEWISNLQSNLETVEVALEIFGYGEQFVMESLVQEIAESKIDGHYSYIVDKLAKFGNRVIPNLNELLEDKSKITRSHACEALKRIGTPEALKAVEEYENLTP